MGEVIFKIWYTVAVLPFLIFLEGNAMLKEYFKKKGVHWNVLYSGLVFFILLLMVLLLLGYR